MKKSLLALSLAASAFYATSALGYQFTDTIQTPANVTANKLLRAGVTQQDVTVLRVQLSDKEKQALSWRTPSAKHSVHGSKLPPAIQLGMNNVPVLNQGRHGSCVTFAISAALDAAMDKGDYISQLCSLELGTHLEKNGYIPSGWDGTWGTMVLEQMMRFGIVSKDVQRSKSCANISEYPVLERNNRGNEMMLTEYRDISENINNKVYWTHLFSNDQVFDWKTETPEKMQEVLVNVKRAIANGHRVTFGTFLIIAQHCKVGACASYQSSKDTWALTKTLETPPYDVGGHEMVITGFDDAAVAYDDQGGKHQGLLTLRNSWGSDVGNNGDFYMSYDYFIKYANEVQEVIEIK